MNEERWGAIVGQIKDNEKLEVLNEYTQDLDEEDGPGSVDVIEFNGPLGKIKLERTTQPLIIDKKSIASRRIGSDATVEYKYSDTETVSRFKAYRWDDNNETWVEMEMERGEMNF